MGPIISQSPPVHQSQVKPSDVPRSNPGLLYNGRVPRRDAGAGRRHAERADEHVDDGDEEDAQHRHVVDLVGLADVLLVFHVVPGIHYEADANCYLKVEVSFISLLLSTSLSVRIYEYVWHRLVL